MRTAARKYAHSIHVAAVHRHYRWSAGYRVAAAHHGLHSRHDAVRIAHREHRHATHIAAAARHHRGGAGSGIASVYSGARTANGEHMNPHALTAAHRSLPFGTHVTVTNNHTGRSVVVRINDRGPFVKGRVIDLSPAAAHAIGVSGLAPVSLSVGR